MEANLFPACAGVIPTFRNTNSVEMTFPRVCGGDPVCNSVRARDNIFSPRVRG